MRSLLAGLCGLLACLLLPVALASVWAAAVATDTDDYVAAVRPLATEPEVQDAVERRLSDAVLARVDGTAVGDRFGDTLATVVTAGVRRVVDSSAFVDVWASANRAAHEEMVRVLENEDADSGGARISLTALAERVLTDLGLPDAAALAPDVTITVASGEDVERAAQVYRTVDRLGTVAPVAWVLLVAITLVAARRRLRSLAWLGLGSALGGLLLLLAVRISVGVVGDQAPAADREIAELVWHAVTTDLRTAGWLSVGVGAAVALGAGLLGGVLGRSRPA